ncbi:MAG TPA: MlaD family protein, partial [Pseudolabrys sp.]|nr:MlaD family protein [Pseudolabrys sp.]
GGNEIGVRFAQAEGVSAGAAVRYKGMKVGSVEAVKLADDLGHVELDLNIDGRVRQHLGAQSMFWIAKPQIAQGNIMGIVSGPHVEVRPVDGKPAQSFIGLAKPPVGTPAAPGHVFVLTADDASGMSSGGPVLFHGIQVGHILGTRLDETTQHAQVRVFVEKKYAGLVTGSSVFWNAGGVSVSTAHGINIDLPSLTSVLKGAVAFDTPETFRGSPAKAGTAFTLYPGKAKAEAMPGGARFAYAATFPQTQGLAPGASVTLQGRQVGRVYAVGSGTAAGGKGPGATVRLTLDAAAFNIDARAAASRDDLRHRLNQAVAALVGKGLRAEVRGGGVLSGPGIALAIVNGAAPAKLDVGHRPPVIPAAAGGSTEPGAALAKKLSSQQQGSAPNAAPDKVAAPAGQRGASAPQGQSSSQGQSAPQGEPAPKASANGGR